MPSLTRAVSCLRELRGSTSGSAASFMSRENAAGKDLLKGIEAIQRTVQEAKSALAKVRAVPRAHAPARCCNREMRSRSFKMPRISNGSKWLCRRMRCHAARPL